MCPAVPSASRSVTTEVAAALVDLLTEELSEYLALALIVLLLVREHHSLLTLVRLGLVLCPSLWMVPPRWTWIVASWSAGTRCPTPPPSPGTTWSLSSTTLSMSRAAPSKLLPSEVVAIHKEQ